MTKEEALAKVLKDRRGYLPLATKTGRVLRWSVDVDPDLTPEGLHVYINEGSGNGSPDPIVDPYDVEPCP